MRLLNRIRISTKVFSGFGIVLTSKDLTTEDKRILSDRVEQIIEKDSWSHEQLVGLVHKLAAEREAVT